MKPRPARARETTPDLHAGSLRVQRQRERVVDFEDAPNRDGSRVERNSKGGRPSEQRAEDTGSRNILYQMDYKCPLMWGPMTEREIPTIICTSSNALFVCRSGQCTWPTTCSPILSNILPEYGGIVKRQILGLHEEQRISGFVHGLKTRSLVEFLSMDLPTTYKGVMEKTYTWIEAKDVATNGAPNDHRESFNRFKKNSSWDNNKGKKNRDMFSPYCGSNHGLVSNLSKSPKEILLTKKVAKTFEQPPRLIRSRRSCDMSKYCHFHEDHGHDTNQCQELRHQIEEAVKSGQLTHLVNGIKKGNEKVLETQLGEWKKGDKDTTPAEAPILTINRESHTLKRKHQQFLRSSHHKGLNIQKTSEPVVHGWWQLMRSHLRALFPKIKAFYQIAQSGLKSSTRWFLWRTRLASERSPLGNHYRRQPSHKNGGPKLCYHKKKLKETLPETEKGVLSCVNIEERIVVNDKHPEQTIVIGRQLPTSFKKKLRDLLRSNVNVFAWTYTNMKGILRTIMVGGKPFNTVYRLNEYKHIEPTKQKNRGLAPEQNEAICKEVEELMKANILREVKYQTWVSNPIMVKKDDGRWKLCVDFIDINKACLKDCYPLPEVNQKMVERDEEKIAFFTRKGVFYYRRIPFGLKNAWATHQRLIDKVFGNQIGRNLEVHVDDMVIKSDSKEGMLVNIQETFDKLRAIKMKLNPRKCSFGVEDGPFLGHLIKKKESKPTPRNSQGDTKP
ncbi:reverse transcriptase domain-containing protein [Tanacetum coccineum]